MTQALPSDVFEPTKTKLGSAFRKHMGLSAASNKVSIRQLAKEHGISRNTVRKARDKTLDALDKAFEPVQEAVDFNLPVTKNWIETLVLSLILINRASYRSIKMLLKDVFDCSISLGKIHTIFRRAADKAVTINKSIDLSDITDLCADEVFHNNKPILNAIDAHSLYCCILNINDHRDGDTWGIHLLDAKDQGLCPRAMISDEADGLLSAQKLVFPYVEHRYDNFHLSRLLMDLRRFYRNRFKSSIKDRKAIEHKVSQSDKNDNTLLTDAIALENKMKFLSKTIDVLISWMEHDVLNKAGLRFHDRSMLYDFILDEFRKLEKIESHRISAVCVTLKNKKALC